MASSIIVCVLAGSRSQVTAAAQKLHTVLTRSGRLVRQRTPQPGQRQSNMVLSLEAFSENANRITEAAPTA
ncbi:hypothetical protein [Dactylosporangium sp. NPDC006015]|uniref:hypothetical protein n=1 Tax=Dactylosporangium sp. NPDC006015 TaxID=3154576 RepID=UPI0033B5C9BC